MLHGLIYLFTVLAGMFWKRFMTNTALGSGCSVFANVLSRFEFVSFGAGIFPKEARICEKKYKCERAQVDSINNKRYAN
jgi:hypothetical protein